MSSEDFIRYLKDHAGNSLRGAIQYNSSGFEALYVRSDIEDIQKQSQIDRMLKRIEPESRSSEVDSFPFGDLTATVRLFEEAIVLHFPVRRNCGVIVTLEPDIARHLTSFVDECWDFIDRD